MIWQNEIAEKAALMRQNRLNFISKLALLGSKQDWSHITAQGGFYCQTGLNKE
jgi:aspartate/tyrosine/aromatic aminotransferase